jgi:phospholipid transport system substrate-binding protein
MTPATVPSVLRIGRHLGHTLLIVMPVVMILGSNAEAGDGRATAAVKQADGRFAALVAKNAHNATEEAQLVRDMVAATVDFFDMRELAALALVDHWNELTSAQQDTLVDLLTQAVQRNHSKLLRKNLQFKWDYIREQNTQSGTVMVYSLVRTLRKGRESQIAVNYLLRPDGDRWKAIDLVIDGVSLVKNYHSEFNRTINKEGVDGLIVRIRKKLAEP